MGGPSSSAFRASRIPAKIIRSTHPTIVAFGAPCHGIPIWPCICNLPKARFYVCFHRCFLAFRGFEVEGSPGVFSAFADDLEHLPKRNDEGLYRIMPSVACHEIGVGAPAGGHDDFIENRVVRVREGFICRRPIQKQGALSDLPRSSRSPFLRGIRTCSS